MAELILASNSPRRRELLGGLGIPFRVEPSRFEERGDERSARDTALAFAEGKAREVFSRFPRSVVLGADTVVSCGGKILGKPHSAKEAEEMLRLLSGRVHSVFSGVCLMGEGLFLKDVFETRVKFYPLSGELIAEYVASGLPLDKAGAYGIQDGYPLVESYEGSYTNVVGFPMELVTAFLKEGKLC